MDGGCSDARERERELGRVADGVWGADEFLTRKAEVRQNTELARLARAVVDVLAAGPALQNRSLRGQARGGRKRMYAYPLRMPRVKWRRRADADVDADGKREGLDGKKEVSQSRQAGPAASQGRRAKSGSREVHGPTQGEGGRRREDSEADGDGGQRSRRHETAAEISRPCMGDIPGTKAASRRRRETQTVDVESGGEKGRNGGRRVGLREQEEGAIWRQRKAGRPGKQLSGRRGFTREIWGSQMGRFGQQKGVVLGLAPASEWPDWV